MALPPAENTTAQVSRLVVRVARGTRDTVGSSHAHSAERIQNSAAVHVPSGPGAYSFSPWKEATAPPREPCIVRGTASTKQTMRPLPDA